MNKRIDGFDDDQENSGSDFTDSCTQDDSSLRKSSEECASVPKRRHLVLDKYAAVYAKRTMGMESSEIRDLLSITARPDIISLAGGLPYTKVLQQDLLQDLFLEAAKRHAHESLQYGPSEGVDSLRKAMSTIMLEEGIDESHEDILVTSGSQQALDLVGKIFLNPGDAILVEAPAYVGGLNAFSAYQPRFVPVRMDDGGIVIEEMEKMLDELSYSGVVPKFLYTVPNFQNPSGVTLEKERRAKLVEIVKDRGFLIIEDNPYGLLRYDGSALPSLRELDKEHVVYLGTLSKIFSSGIRLGWIVAPRPILDKLNVLKQSADLCTSSLSQFLTATYFENFDWRETINSLIKIYRSRRDAMLESMKEFFPEESSWTLPHGGFFVWARFPEYINTKNMLAMALEKKVAYVPGTGFYPDRRGTNCMRLSFSYVDEPTIEKGISVLAEVIKRELSISRSLGLDKG